MSEKEDFKKKAMDAVDSLKETLIAMSDQMYREPELGHQEFKSSKMLAKFLEEHGFEVETGICGMPTSFRAIKHGKPGGPTIAILAEYDALPGIGHGCGHNIIGTAAVGAGAALASLIDDFQGTIVILGTPAEEGAVDNAGGKVTMVECGVFNDVDIAMMIHPSQTDVAIASSNARVALEISFYGKSAHAAGAPHEGINALDAAILTFNGWNALRQHMTEDARIHGVITKGGEAPNIIPDYSEIRMYVRAKEMKYLEELEKKVRNCAEGAALATGARVQFRYTAKTYANMVTNRTLANVFAQNLESLGRHVCLPEEKSGGGSTDMGNVSQVVPSVHAYIAICDPGTATSHSREFAEATVSEMGHRAIVDSAKTLAATAIDVLASPDLLKDIKKEFVSGKRT
ncbi:MAG: M20 family metallopeptidase [Firmicutes bacterium]|nr:M20 family metallopeptidase [Candidatus Fermentithermobacillaceae bacterium]